MWRKALGTGISLHGGPLGRLEGVNLAGSKALKKTLEMDISLHGGPVENLGEESPFMRTLRDTCV